MARDLIVSRQPEARVTLTRSGGGVFEISVDGRLGYSKKATGRFPTPDEIVQSVG